ncbi:MAG: GNAT family N-acetyltransferase [Pseudanabaenaceae cyanobacterium SKYGB_i_bin29]|nr:GNAT family N-acetyltransferase [Pseudanabaenaceae cyanobacterium SKYG29]MDW8422387.1 GNAT family N-acetyltransferase [Pseudanabaenaceae cyanobacterium SKYGB_i_bin29]
MEFPVAGVVIRPLQHRDLTQVAHLHQVGAAADLDIEEWIGLVRRASWLPWQKVSQAYVGEINGEIQGYILVLPVNDSRTTWRVQQIVVSPGQLYSLGSQLIRHCLEYCWEARMWLAEVDEQARDTIALCRQNGFQPLAHLTTWVIPAPVLAALQEHTPALPNLYPIGNVDAPLLYQLENAAMPPQIRQVYDWGVQDFRHNPLVKFWHHSQLFLSQRQEITGYVYESQRKAAIASFRLLLQRVKEDQSATHQLQLTVHPAYTWLYPEMIAQVAQIVIRHRPAAQDALTLVSADYQPEREDYLEKIGATRLGQKVLLARSVWHKVRETKPVLEGLQLSRVLSSLQPAQKPVPGRIEAEAE